MTPADLPTLIAAMAGDRRAARGHAALATAQRGALDAPVDQAVHQTVAAASLHHYYSALESLAERVIRAFGQTPPSGSRWHVELLELAALDVPGVRPHLWSPETARLLRKLLAFRHFFRHAYAVAWDARELSYNLDVLDQVCPLVEADLDQFLAVLRAAE